MYQTIALTEARALGDLAVWDGALVNPVWRAKYGPDSSFQVESVNPGQEPKVPAKKMQVAKRQSYTIRIGVKPDGITHELQDGAGWKILSTVPGTAVAGGRFGFRIPRGQTLFLANFSFQPDRASHGQAMGKATPEPPGQIHRGLEPQARQRYPRQREPHRLYRLESRCYVGCHGE